MIRKSHISIIVILSSILLVACLTETLPPADRAVARWNAIIKKDWETAHKYQSPNYRKTYSIQEFKSSFGSAINRISVKLISVNVSEKNIADIKLELTITYSESGNLLIPTVINERWQLINKTWWHANK